MWDIAIKVTSGLIVPVVILIVNLAVLLHSLKAKVNSLEKNNDSQDMDIKDSNEVLSELKMEVKLISQSQQMISKQLTDLLTKQDERISKTEDILQSMREEMATHRTCPYYGGSSKKQGN